MLYLFASLALNDSLTYTEKSYAYDSQQPPARARHFNEPVLPANTLVAGPRLCGSLPQPESAETSRAA